MEETIAKLKEQARDSWSGEEGDNRAERLEKYLRSKLEEYSSALDLPQEDILEAWEKDRDYSALNYYQESNQPKIEGDYVRVFDTVEDMMASLGGKRFRCPACEAVSTNAYVCNSGKQISKGKTCDWKVYGFLGDLGKGAFIYIKDRLQGETIFMPIAWEKTNNETEEE